MNPPIAAVAAHLFNVIEPLEARIAPATVSINLGSLTGDNGFRIDGEGENDGAGFSVSAAGDVNGDGFEDVIVGAPGVVGDDGKLYVVFGKAGGFGASLNVSELNGSNGFQLTPGAGDHVGFSVSAAGDVNGDHFDDVIVGTLDGENTFGSVFVVFGKATFGAEVSLAALNGSDGFQLVGEEAGDGAGSRVSGAGDVNGDGFDDVIIGADGNSAGGDFAGAVYVVFGKASGFTASQALSGLNGMNGFKLIGTAQDVVGSQVSEAGDVNGDGFDDILFTAIEDGDVDSAPFYVVFGKSNGFAASTSVTSLNGTNGFKIVRGSDTGTWRNTVGSAGDINGDGFDDIILKARNIGSGRSGSSYVLFGNETFAASLSLSTLDGSNGFAIPATESGEPFDHGVSGVGDFNGDGFDDILVGQPSGPDAAYLIFGKASGFSASFKTSSLNGANGVQFDGPGKHEGIGRSVDGVGDFNGDGFADLIIGTDPDKLSPGSSYVVFGGAGIPIGKSTVVVAEPDGDAVTIKVSGKGFTAQDITRDSHGYIDKIDLTRFAEGGKTLNVKLSVKTPTGGTGDGFAQVAHFDATGVKLGKVDIDGNVGRFSGGDGGKIKQVKVSGNFGSSGPASAIDGLVQTMQVGGDFLGDLNVGRIGKLTVGGDVLDAKIAVLGTIGVTKQAKAVAMQSMKVVGGFENSQLLVGYDASGVGVNADVAIGSVKIGGNFEASSLAVGASAGVNGFFGDEDDAILAAGTSVVARIASITINGAVIGTAGSSDHFGVVAEEIAKLKVGSTSVALTKGPRNDLAPVALGGTADVKAREVSAT